MGFKEIGKRIQQAREDKGLSQEQLSRLIGCSQSALSNYEKGKRRLYLTQLDLLAGALDKPIDYFMLTDDENSPAVDYTAAQPPPSRLLQEIEDLSAADRRELLDFLDFLRWRRSQKGGVQI